MSSYDSSRWHIRIQMAYPNSEDFWAKCFDYSRQHALFKGLDLPHTKRRMDWIFLVGFSPSELGHEIADIVFHPMQKSMWAKKGSWRYFEGFLLCNGENQSENRLNQKMSSWILEDWEVLNGRVHKVTAIRAAINGVCWKNVLKILFQGIILRFNFEQNSSRVSDDLI